MTFLGLSCGHRHPSAKLPVKRLLKVQFAGSLHKKGHNCELVLACSENDCYAFSRMPQVSMYTFQNYAPEDYEIS